MCCIKVFKLSHLLTAITKVTLSTMPCLSLECRWIFPFLLRAQPKICMSSSLENSSTMFIMICCHHCLLHTLTLHRFFILRSRTKEEQLLGIVTYWSYWHTSFCQLNKALDPQQISSTLFHLLNSFSFIIRGYSCTHFVIGFDFHKEACFMHCNCFCSL